MLTSCSSCAAVSDLRCSLCSHALHVLSALTLGWLNIHLLFLQSIFSNLSHVVDNNYSDRIYFLFIVRAVRLLSTEAASSTGQDVTDAALEHAAEKFAPSRAPDVHRELQRHHNVGAFMINIQNKTLDSIV